MCTAVAPHTPATAASASATHRSERRQQQRQGPPGGALFRRFEARHELGGEGWAAPAGVMRTTSPTTSGR